MIKTNRLFPMVLLGAAVAFQSAAEEPCRSADISRAMTQGRYEYARMLIQNALEEEPYSVSRESYEAKNGDTYFFTGQFDEAVESYEKVDADALAGEELVEFRYRYGYALMQTGHYDDAYAQFSAMPDYASREYANAALFYMAYICFAEQRYDEAADLFGRVDPEAEPGNARDFYLAQIEYEKGNIDKALSLAKSAARRSLPADMAAENQRVIGECLYLQDDTASAIPYLERYVSAVESPALSAMYILGLSRYDEGLYDAAISALTPVARGDDAMAQSACLYIGQAQLKKGDTDAAILAFDRALRMDADADVQEAAYYNYAVARTRGGQVPFGSSVATFENFLRRYPSGAYAPKVREYLVNGYITDRNYDRALKSIEAIRNPSASILAAKQRVLYALGARDLASGHPLTALEYLNKARQYSRYDADIDAETYLLSGDANFRLENYQDAASDYRRYLALASSDAENRSLARYNLGYAYFAGKNFSQAIKEFISAAEAGDLSAAVRSDAYNRIGDCHYYASDFSGAEEFYGRAYSTSPSSGDYAVYQLAAMQGYARNYSGKIATLERMIQQFPQSSLLPSAYLEKAETYLQLGKTDDAVDTYRVLIGKYPGTAAGRNGYLQLAQTLENTGHGDSATKTYQNIVKMYPTSDEARLAVVALKRSFVEGDRIDELVDFLRSVPGAPEIDPSEIEKMAFDMAEEEYQSRGNVSRLKSYVRNYPSGAYMARAIGYLATDAFDNADDEQAIAYANRLIEEYPDSPGAEDGLAIKAEIMFGRGNIDEAYSAYSQLLRRTSSPVKLDVARMGMIRVARELKHWADIPENADVLLKSSILGDLQKNEAAFYKAEACEHLGNEAEAIKGYQALSANTDDVFGARASVALGELYLSTGNAKMAKKTAEKLVNSSSPHSYWVARGFILLSDANRAQGNIFEADEYLTALRQNYPGSEQDIFMMIDQRLNR